MRVVITLASTPRHLSGVQRHAINVARCLLTRSEITAVHLIVAPWQQKLICEWGVCGDPRLQVYPADIGTSTLSRNLWYTPSFPELLPNCRRTSSTSPIPRR